MSEIISYFVGEYRFLSNFYMSSLIYEGAIYPSSEHAFQAAKTTNPVERYRIARHCATPGEAKREGRKLLLRSDWEQIKIQVMLDIVRIKFSNPDLRSKLITTGDAILIEGNTWNDVFWGVCGGQGQNILGIILMRIRSELTI